MRFYCTSMIQLPCSSAYIPCLVSKYLRSFYPVLVSYCTFYMAQYYIACSFYPVLVSYCTFYMAQYYIAPSTQCSCPIVPFTWHSIILLLLPSARVLLYLLHGTVLYCSFYPVLVSYCTFYMAQYYIAPSTQCSCPIVPFTWHSIILLLLPSARVLLYLLHGTVLYCSFYPVLVSYCTFYMAQYYIAPSNQCSCPIVPFTWHSIILLLLPSARVLLYRLHGTVLYCSSEREYCQVCVKENLWLYPLYQPSFFELYFQYVVKQTLSKSAIIRHDFCVHTMRMYGIRCVHTMMMYGIR